MPTKRIGWWAGLIAALSLVTGTVACDGLFDQGEPPSESASSTWGDTGRSVTYPLDAYKLADEQVRAINTARALLEQRCLKRYGFDVALPERIEGLPFKGIDDRYGLINEQHAQTKGYRQNQSPLAFPFEVTVPHNARPVLYGRELTAQGLLGPPLPEVNGMSVPEGGCQGEANRALGVAVAVDALVDVRRAEYDLTKRAMADARVQAKIAQWRECLKDSGYDYPDPWEAVVHWNGKVGSDGPPTKDEVTAAVTDVQCNRTVGLAESWQDVDVELQEAYVEDHVEQLRLTRQRDEALLRNASRVVAGG